VTEPHVLVVTSAGATSAAVVPVLAALEAAGMRVRAIDVGGAGAPGSGVADRVRRVILGEGAERRLRRELEANPPDVAIAFDPHAALALTVARDQVAQPSPVVGVVAELDPVAAWGQSDCDRFVAIDAEAAVALSDAGADGERVLVVGPLGETAFADAGQSERTAVRGRFGLKGTVVVVEVAGLGGEVTGQLALQLSLAPGAEDTTFLFDASGDADAAAVLRRQVPTLGLRAKLFGATADRPLFWRAADAIVARPRPATVARAMLVGGRLVALVDDGATALARLATALEGRRRAVAARSPLLVSSALEAALKLPVPVAMPDGADNAADIVWVIAGEKRAVVEERRSAARAATTEKVRSATQAASAAARATAMPGDLEDLGSGGGSAPAPDGRDIPDAAELARLRAEVKARRGQLEQSMMAARKAADEATSAARTARDAGDGTAAADAERRADGERARMHTLLAEMAGLDRELADLDAAATAARQARPRAQAAASAAASAAAAASAPPPSRSVDDMLADLKKKGGAAPAAAPRPSGSRTSSSPAASSGSGGRAGRGADVDDELAALKRKMTENKKP
jgi:hypothetical protein